MQTRRARTNNGNPLRHSTHFFNKKPTAHTRRHNIKNPRMQSHNYGSHHESLEQTRTTYAAHTSFRRTGDRPVVSRAPTGGFHVRRCIRLAPVNLVDGSYRSRATVKAAHACLAAGDLTLPRRPHRSCSCRPVSVSWSSRPGTSLEWPLRLRDRQITDGHT